MRPTHKHKVILLGDAATGKTSLLNMLVHESFDSVCRATLSVDYLSTSVKLENGQHVHLQVWDTAGQEKFRSLIAGYVRGCDAAVIVYDISKRKTFDSVTFWTNLVVEERGPSIPVILVGNKMDLNDQRAVSVAEGTNKADTTQSMFIETSAKTGFNVKAVFRRLAVNLLTPPLVAELPPEPITVQVEDSQPSQPPHKAQCLC